MSADDDWWKTQLLRDFAEKHSGNIVQLISEGGWRNKYDREG